MTRKDFKDYVVISSTSSSNPVQELFRRENAGEADSTIQEGSVPGDNSPASIGSGAADLKRIFKVVDVQG